MAEVVMPKMGDSMEEGTVRRWLKKPGDKVAEQEPLAEIETEKATIEIPAVDAGVLTSILVQEGQTVPVGTPIAILNGPAGGPAAEAPATSKKGEQPRQGREQKPSEGAPGPKTTTSDLSQGSAPTGKTQPQETQPAVNGARVKASPLARKVAEAHGVDLRTVNATGPGGRIVEADVAEAIQRGGGAAQPAVAPAQAVPAHALPGTSRPMSAIRKVIARRLVQSKQTIPHFYLTLDVDMRAAARVRAEYNDSVSEDRKISFNDLVVRACVVGLQEFPQLNSQLDGETIKTPSSVNIGVAVALEDGLIVPVIKDAQSKGISALGQETRELAGRARKGGLKPEEYSGGTFSVSNLGMYEIEQFQAIINPPEAAILAVGAIRDTPIVENGQIIPGKQMHLTISVDHRLVDGATAAQFLRRVKQLLQKPLSLFS
jgi:pyruvate dehydrogenase E2 component (dihydrolipoamide acetyltransferase)